MRGKYLSVFGDTRKVFRRIWRTWQIGVICGTQNRLRIRGKYLNFFGEFARKESMRTWRGRKETLGVFS
jgi:hypothetical protein